MKFNFWVKISIVVLSIATIVSCDKDFNELGTAIVGDQHYGQNQAFFDVVAYNQVTDPVQVNNLAVNSLGIYNNGIFGTTKASYVTQLTLGTQNPTFYDAPATISIDSVYFYVPYYATLSSTDADSGDRTYEDLDSIYPISPADQKPIKLSIYRSGYYLREFDENNPAVAKRYYNNQEAEIDAVKGQLLAQDNNFTFKNTETKLFKTDANGALTTTVSERLAPGLFFAFSDTQDHNVDPIVTYFEQNIIQASSDKLYNNNAFKEYFRGLYFKAENAPGQSQGSIAKLNFAQGKVVIIYKDHSSTTDTNAKSKKTLTLNMSGVNANFLNTDFVNPVTPDVVNGDDELYLKGGQGSMAVLQLFGGQKNSSSPDLNTMREQKWLINDASITFTISDNEAVTPNRLYLYDLQNKRPIIDYYYDNTKGASSKYNKYVHGGILLKADGTVAKPGETGAKYKIRITNYLRNLIQNASTQDNYVNKKDSVNVKLGLVVTEGINDVSNYYLKNQHPFQGFDYATGNQLTNYITTLPGMAVVNPLGVRLHGSNKNSVPESTRIRLEVHYTKPN